MGAADRPRLRNNPMRPCSSPGKFWTAGEMHELFRPAAFSARISVRSHSLFFAFFRFGARPVFSKVMRDPRFGLREKILRTSGTGQGKLGQ